MIWKLMLSKNVNNKKCAPKFVFFNEKWNQKDSDDFWCRKLTLNVRFRHFLTPSHHTNLQNSMISFDYSWCLAKNLSNLPWKLHNRYCHIVDPDQREMFFFENGPIKVNQRIVFSKFEIWKAGKLNTISLGQKLGIENGGFETQIWKPISRLLSQRAIINWE